MDISTAQAADRRSSRTDRTMANVLRCILYYALAATPLFFTQGCTDRGAPVSVTTDPVVATDTLSFARDVQPIFVNNCAYAGCHGSSSSAGNFNATTYAGLRAGGYSFGTSAVIPGDSTNSAIMQVVRSNNNLIGLRMPMAGPYAITGLPDASITAIGKWIVQGARNN